MSPATAPGMLGLATVAMGAASAGTATGVAALAPLAAAYFAFELCVGMYFPSIGTLRSRHVPDSHRSVIMNLFGIPLNVLVISVFLSIKRLGVSGALRVATGALGLATACAGALAFKTREAGAAAAATADESQEAEAAPAEA